MAKILVVDDETDLEVLIKQKFRKLIRSEEYQFVFAENGQVALDKIESEEGIDIVLSDINMPVMDGLTFLTHLGERSPLIKAVIVSAYGDMDNIRTAMNRGAYDFITKPIDFKDLSLTVKKTLEHVEELKNTIEAIRENNILKMYVDESVLNFMSAQDYESDIKSNETIEASVAFVDICGFTALSESSTPDTVVNLLNSYFDIMVKEIIDHDGYVDKFMGDAIMAVFKNDHHLDSAIEAALDIRSKIMKLKPKEEVGFYQPKVSIGICSGEMISGNIGAASLKRLDYTVIGDAVNTAQRLQSVAKDGQIVIRESCYSKISQSFKFGNLGEFKLKNKAQPITVYEVIE